MAKSNQMVVMEKFSSNVCRLDIPPTIHYVIAKLGDLYFSLVCSTSMGLAIPILFHPCICHMF